MEEDDDKREEGDSGEEGGRAIIRPRLRWNPKAEQIQILESIFNGGMVNPPKHETIRITQLLQSFGAVSDANVFYWFQNRRRQCQIAQAQAQAQAQAHLAGHHDHRQPSESAAMVMGVDASAYHIHAHHYHDDAYYDFNYQLPGNITVFINGVAREVRNGPMHMKSMFGEDVMLLNSSGLPLHTNDFGFLIQGLHHGETYFLVIN
ncbi:WUSCHEL-related homeobox 11-like [Senna tora]|uniref:WUSCHEL-related homeobox 11-like n=1 Tax=Senna tora TaxID=362788 RepID=A0A834VXA8_9FABA|nr:WUSCHEL-related homeobox 11-like [Senna tora]